MQAALQQLPFLFTQAADPKRSGHYIRLKASPSECRAKLGLLAVDEGSTTYMGTFADGDVVAVKGDSQWPQFFKDMEAAFTGRKVSVHLRGHRMSCTWESSTGAVSFELNPSPDPPNSGTSRLLHALCEFYFWRQGNDSHMRIAELTKREQDFQRKMAAMDAERVGVAHMTTQAAAEEQALQAEYLTLQEELEVLTKERQRQLQEMGRDPEILEEAPLEPRFGTNVGKMPLDTLCRPFDAVLCDRMRVLLQPDDGEVVEEESPRASQGISVSPSSDLQLQLQPLSEDKRQVVLNVMQKVQEWDYDVWAIQDMTGGALFYTAYALFLHWNAIRRFNVDPQIAFNFFSQVEGGYHPNPYHNSVHAADVMHIVHYILGPGELKETAQLTDEDVFAAIIAGMIHDYDHPGLNNNYHAKTQNYLATLYNDRSILENHHLAEVFDLMQNERLNVLHGLTESQYRDCRETMIDMVLATDMGLHAKILGQWKRRIGQDHALEGRKDDQRLALAMGIKMADISNCGRPQPFYLRWGYKLCEEFFLQGDNERARGDNVSPFMDRCQPSMAKSQIAFMNYVVIPMFESISEYLPAMHFSVDICEQNKRYWSLNDDSLLP